MEHAHQACPKPKPEPEEGTAIQHYMPVFLPVLFTFQRMCMAFSFILFSQKSLTVEGWEVCYKDCRSGQVACSMGCQEAQMPSTAAVPKSRQTV